MPLAPLTFVDEPTVMIVPWHDPIVEVVGFEVRSQYVELFWLNVLGPTSMQFCRRSVESRFPPVARSYRGIW